MAKTGAKYLYRRFCALIMVTAATAIFAFVWLRFVRVHNQTGNLLGRGNIGMALAIYLALFVFIGANLRAFKIGVDRRTTVIASVILSLVVTDFFEIFISMAITGQFRFFPAFLWRYALMCLVQILGLTLLVVPMITIYRRCFPPFQMLEVYGDHKNDVRRKLNGIPFKYHIAEAVHYRIPDKELLEKIKKYDATLINDIPSEHKSTILKMCFVLNKRVYISPKIADIFVKYSEELNVIDAPMFLCRNTGISRTERFLKRICTIGNKRFMILKFRSMIVDAEKDGKSHPAEVGDKRITKVGEFIRAYRIDELPQLWNILIGDMSVVGPRPERVEHVRKYTEQVAEFPLRTKVKGGLTGYAQVHGKYNTSALDKLKLDLIYITNFSFLLDIQIILETFKTLFDRVSAERFPSTKQKTKHNTKPVPEKQ